MIKCFKKKNLLKFLKCFFKTLYVFWISFYYSIFFYKFRKNKKDKKRVWVGVSGGVDSSVTVLLLKKKGYEVVGVFIKVYQPEVTTFCWRNEMIDAKKVCKQLKIPFLFLNLEKEYKKNIFDYMINSYKNGNTPNPDVFCNKFIKFGSFLKIALKNGAEFIAMGHYARIIKKNNKFKLLKGIDKDKDQSYFLSAISQYQLSKSIFPIGELKKSEVRKIAVREKLLTAKKKDSQGLCFVGKVNMRKFLQNYLPKKKGDILNLKGEKIGSHEGAVFYTIGSRHGFEILPKFKRSDMGRIFILKKNIKNNTITVGEKHDEINHILEVKEIIIDNINWISGEEIDFAKKYTAMIRYRGKNLEAKLSKLKNNEVSVKFSEPQKAVASGQILVIYHREICFGEGTII